MSWSVLTVYGQPENALVVTTLLLSWLMTHVSFAFRYAHE